MGPAEETDAAPPGAEEPTRGRLGRFVASTRGLLRLVYRDPEQVQTLRDLAIGFEAKAGVGLGELLDVSYELRFVNWKHLLRVCCCGHRRVEHAICASGFRS